MLIIHLISHKREVKYKQLRWIAIKKCNLCQHANLILPLHLPKSRPILKISCTFLFLYPPQIFIEIQFSPPNSSSKTWKLKQPWSINFTYSDKTQKIRIISSVWTLWQPGSELQRLLKSVYTLWPRIYPAETIPERKNCHVPAHCGESLIAPNWWPQKWMTGERWRKIQYLKAA